MLLELLWWCLDLLNAMMPDMQLPGWVTGIGGMAAEVFTVADSVGVWIPWATILIVLGSVFGAAVIGFGIKVARMLISHVTGGGGSAA
jgi:hypothetical protein